MASKLSWPKTFTREALRELFSSLVWSYWPVWGAPVVTTMLGYFGGYAPTLVFLFSLSAFALMAFGLNHFSQWQAARTPADKIRFTNPVIGIKSDETQTPPRVVGIKLGISVHNAAQFPIEVRIDNLETQIANRVPAKQFFSRSINLSMAMVGQFNNAIIDLSAETLNNVGLIGKIKAAISYGRPGKLHHSADQQIWLAMKFDMHGQFVGAEPSVTEIVNV